MSGELGQAYADRGYDVHERGTGLVVDTPNPDPTGDTYFHGANPHKVGFGSRGPEAERITDGDLTADGRSTADVQDAVGGAGWNEQAGSVGEQSAPSGEPDESWRNADIKAFADDHGIEVPSGANKTEMLDAIRGAETE